MSAKCYYTIEVALKCEGVTCLEPFQADINARFNDVEVLSARCVDRDCKIALSISANSNDEARGNALEFARWLARGLFISSGAVYGALEPVHVRDTRCEGDHEVRLMLTTEILSSPSVTLGSGREVLENAANNAAKLMSSRPDPRLVRALDEYIGALSDNDPINMYLHLWKVVEGWAEYMGYRGVGYGAVEALQKVCGLDEGVADDLYEMRNDLAHAGKSVNLEKAKEGLKMLSECVEKRIVPDVRQRLSKTS